MAKRKHHDEQFKAAAVVLLQTNGYPDVPGALKRTAQALGANERTLSRWANEHQSAPTATSITAVKKELDQRLENIAHLMLDHVEKPDVHGKMTGQQAMVAAGIAVDKMRLLRNLPTEIVGILPDFLATLHDSGIDATDFFTRAKQRIEAKRRDE
jgi:hypothetical protein